MVNDELILIAAWAACGAVVLGTLAEWLHARRIRRLGRLAFGPQAGPQLWTQLVPPLRVIALAGIAWSLVVLMAFDGSSRNRERQARTTRHLMVLLDVSPSMQLKDGGERAQLKRAERAAEVIRSVMERAPSAEVKITMACFYTDAMLLVKECGDREIIANFSDDLPLYIAYRPGKTDLVKSLNTASDFVRDFPRKSTTMLVVSDGDAVPDSGLKTLPSSIGELIFAGVGDPMRGTFIDGHLSRQDTASLSQLARRLGGAYHNANVKHVPGEMLRRLLAPDETGETFRVNLRTLAILILATGTGLLCLLPLLLEYFGSAWRPASRRVMEKEAEVAA